MHSSERTCVTRLFLPGRTVIRKEPLGPDAERRARHEVAMLERLRGVAGVAQLAAAPQYPGSVVLEDAGGASPAGLTKPLPAGELAGLGLRLARAVAGMHHRGVTHRDITPANIVVAGDGTACVVDFALASSFAEIRPEFTHHAEIVGTLAYLAPEQTGRTGRPVDQRADLYALGATLYELATGGSPFGTGDPLRLIHDHLARVPVPVAGPGRGAAPGLGNLPEPGLAAMVAEMLRVDLPAVAGLAAVIEPHTRGNPYETVEVLNALRRDGLLAATAAGWRWDEAAVRAPGPVRGRQPAGGARRRPAGGVPAGGGGDGVPWRPRRAEPAAGRHRRAGRRGGPGAGPRPG